MKNKHIRVMILDIDGTLVNSNDAHTHAWLDAMSQYGHTVPFEKVRPLIGMGGDKVLPEVLGIQKDSEEGEKISQARKQIFKERYLPKVQAFPQAYDLLKHMHDNGLTLVIATSSTPDEMQSMLNIIGPNVQDLLAKETSEKDASKSKPDSDVIHAALQKVQAQPSEAMMLGDTPYDIDAAAKAQVQTIAFRCGGWPDSDLMQAVAVYNDPADLLAHYDTSPLVKEEDTPHKASSHIGA